MIQCQLQSSDGKGTGCERQFFHGGSLGQRGPGTVAELKIVVRGQLADGQRLRRRRYRLEKDAVFGVVEYTGGLADNDVALDPQPVVAEVEGLVRGGEAEGAFYVDCGIPVTGEIDGLGGVPGADSVGLCQGHISQRQGLRAAVVGDGGAGVVGRSRPEKPGGVAAVSVLCSAFEGEIAAYPDILVVGIECGVALQGEVVVNPEGLKSDIFQIGYCQGALLEDQVENRGGGGNVACPGVADIDSSSGNILVGGIGSKCQNTCI